MVVDNCCCSIFKLTDNLIYLMLMISLVSRLLYSGTWHNSSTVNITVEDFCQNKYKKTLTRFLWSCATTIKQLCQWLLKNCASDCWTIIPVTVEELCQWLLKNHTSDCWTNGASNCWRIMPVSDEESC